MINGIININKEKGYTSHDVVAKMRGILITKKIGHTGTLDPDAEGVLPLCIGNATKLVELITDKDKTYEAVLKLGMTTDTQDITGKILKTSDVNVSMGEIEKAINKYIGGYMQLPPMYSAIKVNGQKLYELARQGIEINRERRSVMIHDIKILAINEEEHELSITVDCGKGTYIRTLINDIGEDLGCGGTMKSLIRTAVGGFEIQNAYRLSDIEELVKTNQLDKALLKTEDALSTYPKLVMDREYEKFVHNGNPFLVKHLAEGDQSPIDGMVRVYDADNTFIGLYQYDRYKERYHPVKMFL
ncbi:MAG TPA: tRNA pseudouridine(55) synthase TruB [Clostridiales bacterium]|nr:tRNA pseudouridine(55) synthase TruB [Clostridiales bacterium]